MNSNTSPIDVGAVLDSGSWSGRQKLYILIVALAVVLDGFDNQVLGLTITALASEWGLKREDFAGVLALGIIGLSIGTAAGGWLGDRYGRRAMLVISVVLFGVMTGATVLAGDLTELTIFRMLAGLGLGGAMPNATALLAEYTPARRQVLAVTLGIACIPLGGMTAGYLSAFLIPDFGWRAMYIAGGLAPIAVAAALIWIVPESPRYLAGRPASWPKLAQTLNRILGRNAYDADTRFTDSRAEIKAPWRALLSAEFRGDTLALWAAFFTNLLAVYVFFNWMPAMLSLLGLPPSRVGLGAAIYNIGSVIGALACVWLIGRFGTRLIVSALCVGAVAGGLVFGFVSGESAVFALLAVMGACTAGLQILLFAVAAGVYPTQVRSTGVGAALALGRLGAIVSSFAGAIVLQADPTGRQFFWLVAIFMALALVSVLQIKSLKARA